MITRMKQFLGLAATLVLLVSPPGVRAQSVELTLMHVNDVYEISPKRGQGGLAELMTLLERERSRAEHHLFTFGGDLISPSVMSGITRGAQMIDLMNALGVDAAVPGNHEFDFGSETLAKRLAESKFPWLASNVLGADGRPFGGMGERIVRDFAGFKIGVFGLLTGETTHLSSPGDAVTFGDIEQVARQNVEALQAEGADLVIALTHLDIAQDRALAREVKGIDVILGGHDHDPIAFYEGGKLILKAGYDAHYLAVADLAITRKEKRGKMVVSWRPQFRFVSTAGVAPQPTVGALVSGHESKLDEALAVEVGRSDSMLDSQRASVRTGETAIGNLITDAMRASVGADVGLTNGGGIRGDRTYDAGVVLTRKDILSELPFGNVTVLLELTGAQLRAALENGVSRFEDKAGRFPQVSGLTFAFDPARPSGNRITEVKVAGAALDDAARYTVATNDYMAGGGDGYQALRGGKTLIDAAGGTLMASQVMEYITAEGSVAARIEGRITRP